MWKVAKWELFAIRGLVLLGFVVFLGIILLFLTSSGSEAAVITVDDSGGANYLTIQEAVDAANPGDTVYVYNGTYVENVVINNTINLTGENRDGTVIDGDGWGDVLSIHSDWVNVSGFTINNSGSDPGWSSYEAGVKLEGACNCSITNNVISHNHHGILLNYSLGNYLALNNVTSNLPYGIYLYCSDENNIMDNIILDSADGISLSGSNRNILRENDVTSNLGIGIAIGDSVENRIEDNNVSHNIDGIAISQCSQHNITCNEVFYNEGRGISLWCSSGNNIIDNIASNNGEGIDLTSSDRVNITGNTVSLSENSGIKLFCSIGCDLKANTMFRDGIYITGYELEYWSTHDIDAANTVNGKPVYYWKNQISGNIPDGAGQVILVNCTNIKIENQNLTYGDMGIAAIHSSNIDIRNNNVSLNSWRGIYIYRSHGNNISGNIALNISDWDGYQNYAIYIYSSNVNTVSNNTASNNHYGMVISNSSGNNILSNTISNNYYGIDFWGSYDNLITGNMISWNNYYGIRLSGSNNLVYHNRFIGNNDHVKDYQFYNWDNGYPWGGNYWSDYIGVDVYSGINQDQNGNDNIGDEPYIIDIDSRDNYPLMSWGEEIFTTHDYDDLWHNSSFTIYLSVTGGEGGIVHIYYKINDGLLEEVSVEGQPHITMDGVNNTMEYWSIDSAGNQEVHRHLYNIKLDKSPPSTYHDYDGSWYNSAYYITLSANDVGAGVNETCYRINNGSVRTVSSNGHPYIETEGENNTLEYWSVDNFGNEEQHILLYGIKLDRTSPSTDDDYEGLLSYEDLMVSLSASDDLSGINHTYYRINNGSILTMAVNGQPLITTEGQNNTLEYWSSDIAGNIEVHNFIYGIKLNKSYPDLMISPEDIVFSKQRLIEGDQVNINATIRNLGNLDTTATVNFYDGEPNIGLLIDSKSISVNAHDSTLVTAQWNTGLGYHNIYVLVQESVPIEPFSENNVANKSIIVEVSPVLVLSVGDINIFRFESGEERTVPVYVSCYNNSATNVRLKILDDRGLNITVVTPPQNMSKDATSVFFIRIKAPVLKENQKYREEDILIYVVSDEVTSNEESMDIIVGRSAAEMFGWFLLLGGVLAGAGTVGFFGGTEIGKFALFAAAASLYTRLTRSDIEDQETRGMIRGYIQANPGEHYNAIKRALGLKNGTLAYHLKTLEKESLIKSMRDGRYKRFYPPGIKIPEEVITLNKIQELIVGEIVKSPGISQKELSEIIGLSTSTINYHISVMANAGFVRIVRKGKYTKCYPKDEVS